MSTQPKRRIQVASFSSGDISKTQVITLALCACLMLCALGSAWMAAVSIQYVSKSRVAAQLMKTTAIQAEQGAKNYGSGGSAMLATASAYGPAVNAAFTDLGGNPLQLAPSREDPGASAAAAWSSFGGTLSELVPSVSAAAELSAGIGASTGNIVQLIKAIESSGKSESAFKKEYESAQHLFLYSEAGFGAASVRRVDYDLRVVAAGLGASELKSNTVFITPLISTAKVANDKQISRDQLTRLAAAAALAKNSADALGASAAQSVTGTVFVICTGALALAGIALSWFTLLGILGDVGRRYHRSIQQFRIGEGDRKELVDQLILLGSGQSNDIELSNSGSEFADIAVHVNTILHMQTKRLGEVRRAVREASDGHDAALSLIESTEAVLQGAVDGISEAVAHLSDATEIARLVHVDVQAASFAAQEAGNHSSDANRMSQDATSRLDALRDGLQETSKGIKRLGERTQEIDAVVDLMEVLSAQIGVLALNANLEAERAGDAGAGFRLVAREVQTLSRKSEEALERMSTLIKGAQADARGASESIERSTMQVISGSNISAVSQALLVALPQLSYGVSAMTKSIANAGKDHEVILSKTVVGLRDALNSTRDAMKKTSQAMVPMATVRNRLDSAAITEQ